MNQTILGVSESVILSESISLKAGFFLIPIGGNDLTPKRSDSFGLV